MSTGLSPSPIPECLGQRIAAGKASHPLPVLAESYRRSSQLIPLVRSQALGHQHGPEGDGDTTGRQFLSGLGAGLELLDRLRNVGLAVLDLDRRNPAGVGEEEEIALDVGGAQR